MSAAARARISKATKARWQSLGSEGEGETLKPQILNSLPLADSLGTPELARFAGKTLPSHTPKIPLSGATSLHTGHMPTQGRGEAVETCGQTVQLTRLAPSFPQYCRFGACREQLPSESNDM